MSTKKVDSKSNQKNPQSKSKPKKITSTPKVLPKVQEKLTLKPQIFAIEINKQAIFDVIQSERASLRQGTHKVKNRAEVRGGGAKPWRQKGTGRARAGSNRSPIWVGGGVVFGPTNQRNYKLKVNKKVRRLAFFSVLTLKAKEKAILVHDFKVNKPSTKTFLKELDDLNLNKKWKKFLIVNDNQTIYKSARNLKQVLVNRLEMLHIDQIVNCDAIIFSKPSFKNLEGMVK